MNMKLKGVIHGLNAAGKSLLMEIANRLNLDFEEFSQGASFETSTALIQSKVIYLNNEFHLALLRAQLVFCIFHRYHLRV